MVTFTNFRSTHTPTGIQAATTIQDDHGTLANIFAEGDTKRKAAENLVMFMVSLGTLKRDDEGAEPEPEPEPPKKPTLRIV